MQFNEEQERKIHLARMKAMGYRTENADKDYFSPEYREEFEKEWEKAKVEISCGPKFFARLILSHDWHICTSMELNGRVEEVETLMSDGTDFYINPGYFMLLTLTWQQFGLKHEVLHHVLAHSVRGMDYPEQLQHIAADIVVNQIIVDESPLGRKAITPGAVYDETYRDWSMEEILRDMFEEKERLEEEGYNFDGDQDEDELQTDGQGDFRGQEVQQPGGPDQDQGSAAASGDSGKDAGGSKNSASNAGADDSLDGSEGQSGDGGSGEATEGGAAGGTEGLASGQGQGSGRGRAGGSVGGSPGQSQAASHGGGGGLGTEPRDPFQKDIQAAAGGQQEPQGGPKTPLKTYSGMTVPEIMQRTQKHYVRHKRGSISQEEKNKILTQARIEAAAAVAAAKQESMRGNQAGQFGSGLQRLEAEMLTPRIDWKEEMREFTYMSVGSDYATFGVPNRRYAGDPTSNGGVIMPGMVGETIGPIYAIVDVSGSVPPKLVSQFLTEQKGLLEDVNPVKLHIIQIDTDITSEQTFEVGDDPTDMEITGGGGTVFKAAFDRIAEDYDMMMPPVVVIVLTDMGIFDLHELECDIPTLWINYGPRGDYDLPFGRLVPVEEDPFK